MSAFTENTSITPNIKNGTRVTTKNVLRYIDYENKKWKIIIPKWYEFDWASIPNNLFAIVWLLAVFVSPWFTPMAILGYYLQSVDINQISAALLHDWLYVMPTRATTLAEADRQFRVAMIACGTRPIKAWIMRLWVRVWGRYYRHWYKRKMSNLLQEIKTTVYRSKQHSR